MRVNPRGEQRFGLGRIERQQLAAAKPQPQLYGLLRQPCVLPHWQDRGGVVIGVLYPLVARAGALAEVDSVLAAARAGRGALAALTGEPGIGKTRLAEAAADRAAGFEIIWTWCPSAAGGAPLRPWSRVVRALAASHAAAAQLVAGSPVPGRAGRPGPRPGRGSG
jgi:hypothetical protein